MAKLQLLLLLFLFSFAAAPSMTGVVGINLGGIIRRLFRKRPFKPKPDLPNRNAPSSPLHPNNAPSTDVQTLLYSGDYTFLMELAIGTPPLSYSAIMSTGSDLIWTRYVPCHYCASQPTSLYDPSQSSTYANYSCDPSAADCSYYYGYGDGSFTQGLLGFETFTFGSAVVPDIAFGCGNNNSGNFDNSSGIVGMGRGSWSLVSQLGYGRFSYCLTPFGDTNTSRLLLGDMVTLTAQAQSTPFVPNPPSWPSFYYLSLQGITVGGTELPIPSTTFSIAADGTGGMIIDSSTTLTMLVDPAYSELKGAFESQINLPVADGSAYGLDICFAYGGENVTVPGLVFHFEGADMELPLDNYIAADSSVGLLCVVVVASSDLSIFGNYMQQNMHVLYDLVGETLSFEAAQCDQL
ncbi:aspartic proteinase nepenthesin-1-like [Curcuma longa]|uniref:aspartic proteinase nepenthesin-1-like n=1 Tax=Curcuma longa TaxID=136217 RepID=UPI003D9F8DDD